MNEKYTIHSMKFEHHLLKGTHYEIGQKQGKIIKKNKEALKMYTSGKFNIRKSKFKNFEEVYEFYDKLCPGLSDEVQGFAEEIETDLSKLFLYDFPYSIQHCSQFALLPAITKNSDVLVGRSYEWNHNDEDLQLRTTHVNGKYKHIGFSGMVYGRYDGLNNQGLCVTNSAGGAWDAEMKNKSLNWALATRVLLDNCKDVNQASKLLEMIPVEGSTTFILSDKSGNVALMESFDGQFAIERIDNESEKQHMIATNHYNLDKNLKYNQFNNPWLLPNSKARYEIIESFIQLNESNITQNDVITFLSKEFPNGLCCHWYTDFFGTLWSVSFNVSESIVDICFGPPTHNEWFQFRLNDTVERVEYDVVFPDKRITT